MNAIAATRKRPGTSGRTREDTRKNTGNLVGSKQQVNVSGLERVVSAVAGGVLARLGVARRDWSGALIAGVGAALLYRGATGKCHAYSAMGINTLVAERGSDIETGIHVTECFLINKPQDELYRQWHNFESLPKFMSHLKSVRMLDDKRSEWTVEAPFLVGGEVTWEAQTTVDQPNERIAWETLPGSAVGHRGSISFAKALGDRGTVVRIELEYSPPGGQIGHWVAKLFGDDPEQQIRSDVRKFKRLVETGEIPTIQGQPSGSCYGMSRLLRRGSE